MTQLSILTYKSLVSKLRNCITRVEPLTVLTLMLFCYYCTTTFFNLEAAFEKVMDSDQVKKEIELLAESLREYGVRDASATGFWLFWVNKIFGHRHLTKPKKKNVIRRYMRFWTDHKLRIQSFLIVIVKMQSQVV